MLLLQHEPLINAIWKFKSNDLNLKMKIQEMAEDATTSLVEMIKEERKHKDDSPVDMF